MASILHDRSHPAPANFDNAFLQSMVISVTVLALVIALFTSIAGLSIIAGLPSSIVVASVLFGLGCKMYVKLRLRMHGSCRCGYLYM